MWWIKIMRGIELTLSPEQFRLIKEKINTAKDNFELYSIAPLSIKSASSHDFNVGAKYILDTFEELLLKCVEKEDKPVNEACLSKRVFVGYDEKDWKQALFIGKTTQHNFKYVTLKSESPAGYGYDALDFWPYAKRIPNYDYGDNDENCK